MSARDFSHGLSRRGVIGSGAAAALFPAAVWGQDAPKPPLDAMPAVVAGRDANAHLTIDVEINGCGPYRFVVDTGADCSVVSDVVAKDLRLAKRQKVLVEGIVRTIPAETVHIDDMGFGVLHREDLVLPVLPREWLKADGFLGLDMIDHDRVTFDFRNRQLRVEEGYNAWRLDHVVGGSNLVSADGRHGRLRALNCFIDGVMVSVFIDTGAEASMGNPALFKALYERDPEKYLMNNVAAIEGVTGGSLYGRVVNFRKLKIKDLNVTNGSLIVADLKLFDRWGMTHRPAILVGMNFLRQFNRVSIDYRLKMFDFQLARQEWYLARNPSRYR